MNEKPSILNGCRCKFSAKKAQGAKRLTPIIQKYAPAALEMFGNYKDEVLAALSFGSFTFGAVKQIKSLKAEDAKAKTQADPEQVKAELDAHAAH
ncbi:hypothetical protein BGP78_13175 [Pseudoalteromonas sp. MSK9-3]|uniref:hypothetical protein n=1 Tax=Pseudoalteromonas sp. MSK9-3 TaxID=1897633 RepID=UPI000E6C3505|nr:hypothetical protein [Pseudoalteromonas sp. MSK9-3]RJE76355.1 hypothetical protein BGP78_13175 [Pseudoalteromonas sp. MSK9-3]